MMPVPIALVGGETRERLAPALENNVYIFGRVYALFYGMRSGQCPTLVPECRLFCFGYLARTCDRNLKRRSDYFSTPLIPGAVDCRALREFKNGTTQHRAQQRVKLDFDMRIRPVILDVDTDHWRLLNKVWLEFTGKRWRKNGTVGWNHPDTCQIVWIFTKSLRAASSTDSIRLSLCGENAGCWVQLTPDKSHRTFAVTRSYIDSIDRKQQTKNAAALSRTSRVQAEELLSRNGKRSITNLRKHYRAFLANDLMELYLCQPPL